MHTTDYRKTFIAAAKDSKALRGTRPREGAKPSKALRAFMMIDGHPYEYTSDDVIFTVHADHNSIPEAERQSAREAFFSRPQPCLRASDLAKKYGWGVHCDSKGRVALYGVETEAYRAFVGGRTPGDGGEPVAVKYAMRSRRG